MLDIEIMPQIETCINTLKAPADQLLKQGIDPPFIMANLGGPPIYARNLWLIRRARRSQPPA